MHGRGRKPCPRCKVEDLDGSLLEHLMVNHREELNLGSLNANIVMENLKATNLNFLCIFHTLY